MGSSFKISDFLVFNLPWNSSHQNSTPIINFYNISPANLLKLREVKYV
jgi:hypothetical protein